VCVCVYIYTYFYVRIHIHTYMHIRIHTCIYIHICICILCLHQATAKAAIAWLHNCVGRWCLRCSLVSLPPSFLDEFCALKLWSECALSRLMSYSLLLLLGLLVTLFPRLSMCDCECMYLKTVVHRYAFIYIDA